MGDVNQDDIDKLLQEAMGDDGGAADAAPTPAPAAPDAGLDLEGVANQDDIDALFSAVGGGADVAVSASAPAPAPAPAPEPVLEGAANQDDIDAMFSAANSGTDVIAPTPAPAPAPVAAPAPASAPAPAPEPVFEGVANQDDIDAMFSAAGGMSAPAPEEEKDEPSAPEQDDQSEEEADADLDAILSSVAGGEEGDAPAPIVDPTADSSDDFDMDALLAEVAGAAPPPPPPKPKSPIPEMADTTIMDPDIATALAHAEASADTVVIPSAPASPPPPSSHGSESLPDTIVAPPRAPLPSLPQMPSGEMTAPSGPRREFSVLYGAGEVESVANQINALLNAMSEKAHGYMQAWIAADSEAKELRARALAEERRRTNLESEKEAFSQQVDELRSRLGEVEGAKIAVEESRRTLETSFEAKTRELESRVKLLSSEADSLKDELTRARNEATGVDIESRRVRFEVDRLKNEVESERMERLRIQRALENREKEIQAMQAQATGQASSLFIDELHRLVRRLETELEVRSSGAHAALKQLDRIEVSEDMVPVVSNLRAALLQALGQNADADDAIKSLGREAGGVKGGMAVAPQKAEMVSFESALSTYNLSGAIDVAGALLREATATPSALMRKVYQCPALRRPEVGDYLEDLTRLLEGLRTVQEAGDRTRGAESAESEVFYVHLFDFLHNLVKLKLINRMSGDIWRLFLDLRGKFSFVTSDRQWAEYRDGILRGKTVKQ